MRLLLKNLLFSVVVPGTVAVYVPVSIAGGAAPGGGLRLGLAAVLFVIGGSVYAWCVWDFASFGRGTPAPIDAPSRLVVRGLYRFSRNPMYVGVLSVVLAWAVLYGEARMILYAGFVGSAFHLFIVLYEEPHLAQVFGDDYERYRQQVGRWLPRPPRGVDSPR